MQIIYCNNVNIEEAISKTKSNLKYNFSINLLPESLSVLYNKSYPYGINIKVEKPFNIDNYNFGRGRFTSSFLVDMDVMFLYPCQTKRVDPLPIEDKVFFI
jgi:hypothetical protein